MTKDFKFLPLLFLAILVLIPIGFNRYITTLFSSVSSDSIIHIHFSTMLAWCALLLLQPLLILNRKHKWHKLLGKLAFFFMPVVLVVMYLTIGLPTATEPVSEIAENIFMPFTHMLIFAAFYLIAMLNKSKRDIHLRCIIISSMALFGPTLGRMDLGFLSDVHGGFELLFIDLILISFLLFDIYKKNYIKPFIWGLGSYLAVHIGTLTFAHSSLWQKIVVILYY